MTASIRLWGTVGACSLAPHILLREIGIPYEAIIRDLKDGITDDVKKLNPKARIPVLELDSEVITENVAILTVIAQQAPERKLLGGTDVEKARVYEYLAYLSGTVHGQAFGGLFRPGRFSDDESMFKAIQERAVRTLMECYEYIEAGLKGVHAVGDQLTVVDPYLYVFWRWGAERIPDMHARFPKYAALVAELGRLDSVIQTLEEENIEGYLTAKSSR